MSQKIDQVAEALLKECLDIFGSTWSKDVARRLARVAVEAMREPTEMMLSAAHRNNHPRDIETWQTMIDEAIK